MAVNKIDYNKLKRCIRHDLILIGYPEGESAEGKLDTSKLAEYLHDGTATMPDRPFLEEGIQSERDKLNRMIKESYSVLIETGRTLNHKIATFAVGAVQKLVREQYYNEAVPVAPATKKRKEKAGKETV